MNQWMMGRGNPRGYGLSDLYGFIWIFMDLYGFIWIYELYRIIYELKLLSCHYMNGVQIVQTPWKNEEIHLMIFAP